MNSEEQFEERLLNGQNVHTVSERLIQVPKYKSSYDVGSLELEFDFARKQKLVAKKNNSVLRSER
ncbi:unnamed protein product (macronuclear) [Paramecium tetraurelia]|uniref:Uncharacterized protein n=1 Tax=Paramecium tetraurelia TaxID=5888 RepID=A0CQG1_PARTE|nr:uncharacterized protein GSPATT00009376001 [Paramecium tetraurelia]CAK73028.1 unnamed protein product [Paramecium tetraurelia]|eukprot:XP_001440425.1 hypothetical protein (macronuclear) [Paramecium tetraurelia strain d4-2]